jgi:hypothetical protein
MTALERFRIEKDDFYSTSPHSPLTVPQKRSFHGLHYFPENPDLDLEVEVEEFPVKQEIEMQTTTGDIQTFERFGRFHLTVEGQEAWLTVYRNESGYFLPFVDAQAGKETYGAGRYLEPEEVGGGRFRVDFNLAYNPYCAYNEQWSCPITPAENRLKVPVCAGEKIFDPH